MTKHEVGEPAAREITVDELVRDPLAVRRRLKRGEGPLVLKGEGEDIALLQPLAHPHDLEETRAFLRALLEGLEDIEKGRVMSLESVRRELEGTGE